jgi:hypothetical protein
LWGDGVSDAHSLQGAFGASSIRDRPSVMSVHQLHAEPRPTDPPAGSGVTGSGHVPPPPPAADAYSGGSGGCCRRCGGGRARRGHPWRVVCPAGRQLAAGSNNSSGPRVTTEHVRYVIRRVKASIANDGGQYIQETTLGSPASTGIGPMRMWLDRGKPDFWSIQYDRSGHPLWAQGQSHFVIGAGRGCGHDHLAAANPRDRGPHRATDTAGLPAGTASPQLLSPSPSVLWELLCPAPSPRV